MHDDGVIDKEEFTAAMGFQNKFYVDRMFQLFDENGDGAINFTEFLCGLSILSTKARFQWWRFLLSAPSSPAFQDISVVCSLPFLLLTWSYFSSTIVAGRRPLSARIMPVCSPTPRIPKGNCWREGVIFLPNIRF